MSRSYPGSTPGIDPRSQWGDSKAIQAKKNFCDVRTDEAAGAAGWTDRRDSRNSVVDSSNSRILIRNFSIFFSLAFLNVKFWTSVVKKHVS